MLLCTHISNNHCHHQCRGDNKSTRPWRTAARRFFDRFGPRLAQPNSLVGLEIRLPCGVCGLGVMPELEEGTACKPRTDRTDRNVLYSTDDPIQRFSLSTPHLPPRPRRAFLASVCVSNNRPLARLALCPFDLPFAPSRFHMSR